MLEVIIFAITMPTLFIFTIFCVVAIITITDIVKGRTYRRDSLRNIFNDPVSFFNRCDIFNTKFELDIIKDFYSTDENFLLKLDHIPDYLSKKHVLQYSLDQTYSLIELHDKIKIIKRKKNDIVRKSKFTEELKSIYYGIDKKFLLKSELMKLKEIENEFPEYLM